MKENYIKAILELLKAGKPVDEVIEGLKKTLKSNGHSQLLESVLRGVNRVISTNKSDEPKLILAKEADKNDFQKEIDEAFSKINAKPESVNIEVDETLVGGFVVEANNRRLDQSYKKNLVKLYRSLTN